MKPGATTFPPTSMTRSASASSSCPDLGDPAIQYRYIRVWPRTTGSLDNEPVPAGEVVTHCERPLAYRPSACESTGRARGDEGNVRHHPGVLCHDIRDNVKSPGRALEDAGFDHIWEGDHTLPWQHSSGHSSGSSRPSPRSSPRPSAPSWAAWSSQRSVSATTRSTSPSRSRPRRCSIRDGFRCASAPARR